VRCEQLVARVAPRVPRSHRIAQPTHLGVQLEYAALPVEEVELVQGTSVVSAGR
jgi:hypothetical protein